MIPSGVYADMEVIFSDFNTVYQQLETFCDLALQEKEREHSAGVVTTPGRFGTVQVMFFSANEHHAN